MDTDGQPDVSLTTNKHKDFFEYVVYIFTIVTPLLETPQALEIYMRHSARDVSPWTWGFFCIDNLVWIVYAARKHWWPVLLTSTLYEIIEVSIFIGILLYR